jgi:hypothetical protein
MSKFKKLNQTVLHLQLKHLLCFILGIKLLKVSSLFLLEKQFKHFGILNKFAKHSII